VKNPDCWQASQAPAARLVFPALTGNQTSQLMLASGNYDWSTLFVPNIHQSWVNKDPGANRYWFPPGGTITLYLNLTQAPFSSMTFRQGLSDDRATIAQKAEDGYVRPASQSGMLLPGMRRWLAPSLPGGGKVSYQPQQAAALFARAGYRMSGGKLTSPGGKPVTMTIITPDGFTDWLQGAQVIQQQLAKLGITASIQTPQYAAYYSDLQTGHFDAAIGAFGGTGSPYLDLNALLSSSAAAPVGQPAASNFGADRAAVHHQPGPAEAGHRRAGAGHGDPGPGDRPVLRRDLGRVQHQGVHRLAGRGPSLRTARPLRVAAAGPVHPADDHHSPDPHIAA